MQRNSIILLITLFVVPVFCDASSYVDHLRKKLEKAMQETYEDVTECKEQEINKLFDSYNPIPLSSENEQFIRDVLNEVGLDGNAINLWHKEGVYACAIGPNICIDQDWFNTLNEEQKRFVIGHEAMHIKGNHIDYKTYIMMNKEQFEPVEILSLGFEFETEADMKAAKKLNCCDGGISVLEAFRKKKLHKIYTSENPGGIDDHPSCAERIYNLKKLKQQLKSTSEKKTAQARKRMEAENSWPKQLAKWLWWQKKSEATAAA